MPSLMQTQIMFLKIADLLPLRSAVNAAVESWREQVRKVWAICCAASAWNAAGTDKRRSRQWCRILKLKL
jgi:hypothetical protein